MTYRVQFVINQLLKLFHRLQIGLTLRARKFCKSLKNELTLIYPKFNPKSWDYLTKLPPLFLRNSVPNFYWLRRRPCCERPYTWLIKSKFIKHSYITDWIPGPRVRNAPSFAICTFQSFHERGKKYVNIETSDSQWWIQTTNTFKAKVNFTWT